jgi:hypothetical protein
MFKDGAKISQKFPEIVTEKERKFHILNNI